LSGLASPSGLSRAKTLPAAVLALLPALAAATEGAAPSL
jgi:hypothetical protein